MKNFYNLCDSVNQKGYISIVIVTRNKPKEVSKIVNIIMNVPCVHEIIIIDSSSAYFHEKLNEYLSECSAVGSKDIKILRFPPLGSSVMYEFIGLSISKNDLVFYLEDDEYITQKDLITLCEFVHKNYPRFKAFLITRREHYLRDHTSCLRVFNKRFVRAIGIIHWHFITREKPKHAPIMIDHQSKITLRTRLKSLKSYALIDSYQIGYKVHMVISASTKGEKFYKIDGSSLNRVPKDVLKLTAAFYRLCSCLLGDMWGSIIFVLLAFNIYNVFRIPNEILLKNPLSGLIESIIYPFYITFCTLRSPYKHAKIWRLTVKNGGFSNLIRKSLPSITNCLDYDENPVENFKKLIDAILERDKRAIWGSRDFKDERLYWNI